jgi:hypothetical protein
MKIAQLAPLAESVPPKLYGGTERVVSWLTEELVALGHDVTLFASADSTTGGTLAAVWPRATEIVEDGVTGFLVNTEAEAVAAVKQVGRLDRRRVRYEFERRFSSRRMAEDYLRLYAELVEQPALSKVCGVSPTK